MKTQHKVLKGFVASATVAMAAMASTGASAKAVDHEAESESYRPVVYGPAIIVRRPPPPVYIPGPVVTVGGCDYYGCW